MATKKATNNLKKLMDITPYPIPSQYELENFYSSSAGVSFPRRIIEVVNKIRELESSEAVTAYQKSVKQANIETFTRYLEKFDLDTLCNLVNSWEGIEGQYWIDTLGKRAAIELIAEGKVSKETMEMMTKLPEEGYVKASQLCVQLANAIKNKTVQAEEAIGIKSENTGSTIAPIQSAKKKLNLKNL